MNTKILSAKFNTYPKSSENLRKIMLSDDSPTAENYQFDKLYTIATDFAPLLAFSDSFYLLLLQQQCRQRFAIKIKQLTSHR